MRAASIIFLILLLAFVVTAAGEPDGRTIDDLFKEGADAYNRRQDYDSTLELMNRVIEANPDHDAALYYRARVNATRDKLDEADKDIDRALALRPDEQRYLYLKGRIFEKRGDMASALEWYSKALEHRFQSDALHGRIRAYLETGEYEKALDDCGWLHKHEPKPGTKMLHARALLGLGRYEEALVECDGVLGHETEEERKKTKEEDRDKEKEKERTARNFLTRAEVYLKLGEYEEAYYDMVTASWLERTKVEPILALGNFFLLYQPDYRQAIAYYSAAIEVDEFKEPKSAPEKERHERPVARLRRAQAYLALNAKLFSGKALDDFTRYIQLEPDDSQGYGARAKLYLSLGKSDKALADIRKALELDAENAEYKKTLDAISGTAEAPDTPRGDEGTDTTESEEAPQ